MRILFIGTVDFSRHCLTEVLRNGGEVVGVLTRARENAGVHSDFADLSDLTSQYSIPLHHIQNINESENIELIRTLSPDVVFVFGWSQIISTPILDIPRFGCVGSHPTLLPKNRGRHPIVWALVKGLGESGLTFFYLNEAADAGDILWQQPFGITVEDDAGSLYGKIKYLASKAISEFLPQLESGTAPRYPQDHSQATYWRRRTEKDGEIDWTAPTATSYNLVRALTHPYVGAHTYAGPGKVTVWKAALPQNALPGNAESLMPGMVFGATDGGFYVRTGDGHLVLHEFDLAEGTELGIGNVLGVRQ